MTSMQHAHEKIVFRMGRMSDMALDEISVLPKTRDIFCQSKFGFKQDKNAFAAVQSFRIFGINILGPNVMYHPMLEEHGNALMNLKIMGHENGHYIREIQRDILNPFTISWISLGGCTTATGVEALDGLMNVKKYRRNMSRRDFMEKLALRTTVAGAILTGSYNVEQMASYHEESDADMIADALVPELTMGPCLSACLDIYKQFNDDADSQRNKNSLSNIVSDFLSNHPTNAQRGENSRVNCQRFAKNSALWASI